MAFMDFLNHKCDIYHIREEGSTPGYGLPEAPAFSYPDEPDVAAQACHFGVKSATMSTELGEPANELSTRDKLTLPYGTDVRINDKVVNCGTGYEYIAEQPVTVHGNHHMYVWIKRVDRHKEL